MSSLNPAVVLLSGGLDSATALACARDDGFDPCAMTFSYGQRHAVEVEAARTIAAAQGVSRHIVVPIDLTPFGGSALTDHSLDVPKGRSEGEMGHGIPVTYVPARNTIFLSLALAWAEVMEASDIYIGVNARDYSGYPDCRPAYIKAFQEMANLATRGGVEGTVPIRLQTPLIDKTKSEIIRLGTRLGVDYALTRSCYDPDEAGRACGNCDSCLLRLKGFREAGLDDPAPYAGRAG